DYVVQNSIEGAFVECGLWKGGSLMAIALRLIALGESSRELFGYDTFTGMTKPSEFDADYRDRPPGEWWPSEEPDPGRSEQDVRAVLEASGYSPERITLVAGPVEKTIPERAPARIALLRLDTDWYQSTRHELLHLYPCLAVGGVLVIDDYGHFRGARQAVDEFFEGKQVLLHRVDYTARLAVKQD